ncbi:Uma2 family endonuclease [Hymenobacter saemangeumensis]|uniref:Uma2 family endonuclease n=2 Tax=Hymenobacter saemangeumensis TaxID=1084522 RepID=A0ABP8IKQ9_9BACT
MGHAEQQKRRYTPAEYFALEEQSVVRHEYFDGEVFAMAGASKAHNTIAQNLVIALRSALRGQRCQVFMEGVRLAVQENFYYTYPDVMVSCAPADFQDEYLVRQPVLIMEVLSPSTAEYDRTEKFSQYRKLASLQHYILVSQATWAMDWYRRDEAGQWIHRLLTEPADILDISDLGLRLPLVEVYEASGIAPIRLGPPTTR